MIPAERTRIAYPDYLAMEATSETKHEYLRGEVWAIFRRKQMDDLTSCGSLG